ncbi:MAG TPA: SRPBCC family protein [Streptosporangiaceae bacterium]
MYSFSEEATITGDISAIWSVATDVAGWASWDPHEEKSRFAGEFVAGAKGWSKPAGAPAGVFTITEVEPERMWAARAGLPFGHLRGENRYEPAGDGKVKISKRVEVHGPFGPLFHLIWEKRMRADMHRSFAALETEARRRG